MTKFTKASVKKVLKDFVKLNKDEIDDYANSDLANQLENLLVDYYGDEPVKQSEGFVISLEDGHGGEGEGDEYWKVYKIENTVDKTVTYVRFEGYYNSHEGHCYDDGDDFVVVYPKEVMKIEWSNKP